MKRISIEIASKGSNDVHERTTAQTEDLDMVARFRGRQGEQCRREEHCFVIGMGDENADALITETGKGSPCDLRGVQPCCCQDYGNGESEVELHALLLGAKAVLCLIRYLLLGRPGRKKSNGPEALSSRGTCIGGRSQRPVEAATLSPRV